MSQKSPSAPTCPEEVHLQVLAAAAVHYIQRTDEINLLTAAANQEQV